MAINFHYSQKSIDFITKAARQKKSDWLEKNREEYEDVLVLPTKEIITNVAKALQREAPGYRFPNRQFARLKRGADQSKGPFRDWVGVSITRDSGSRYEDLPYLYFHLSEEDQFTAGGLYMPSADQTKHIRKWISEDASALEELFEDRDFKKIYPELGTERMLKTKPRDYSIDHPKIEWLKLSAWYVWRPIPKKVLFSKKFDEVLIEDFRQVLRLNRILDLYTKSWPKISHADSILKVTPRKMDWDD